MAPTQSQLGMLGAALADDATGLAEAIHPQLSTWVVSGEAPTDYLEAVACLSGEYSRKNFLSEAQNLNDAILRLEQSSPADACDWVRAVSPELVVQAFEFTLRRWSNLLPDEVAQLLAECLDGGLSGLSAIQAGAMAARYVDPSEYLNVVSRRKAAVIDVAFAQLLLEPKDILAGHDLFIAIRDAVCVVDPAVLTGLGLDGGGRTNWPIIIAAGGSVGWNAAVDWTWAHLALGITYTPERVSPDRLLNLWPSAGRVVRQFDNALIANERGILLGALRRSTELGWLDARVQLLVQAPAHIIAWWAELKYPDGPVDREELRVWLWRIGHGYAASTEVELLEAAAPGGRLAKAVFEDSLGIAPAVLLTGSKAGGAAAYEMLKEHIKTTEQWRLLFEMAASFDGSLSELAQVVTALCGDN